MGIPENPHRLPSGAIVQVLTPASLQRLWTAAPNLPLEGGGEELFPLQREKIAAFHFGRNITISLPFRGRGSLPAGRQGWGWAD